MHQTAVVVTFVPPSEDCPYGGAAVFDDWELNDAIDGQGCAGLDEFWNVGSDGFERIEDMFNYGTDGAAKVSARPDLRCVEVSIPGGTADKVSEEDWKLAKDLFSKITPSDFRRRTGSAYTLGKILAGTTFDDLVFEGGGHEPVRTWVSGLGRAGGKDVTFYVVQVFDTDP